MFKTKEELKLKPSKGRNMSEARYQFNSGIDSAFKSFKERIDFYKRYVHDFVLLKKEHPEIYKEMVEWVEGMRKMNQDYAFLSDWLLDYAFGGWLFDYVFGDVIE